MQSGTRKALYKSKKSRCTAQYNEMMENLVFSEETCLEKEKVRLKVTSRKLKRRWELNKSDPQRKREPHICSDWEVDTSPETSSPVESELLV